MLYSFKRFLEKVKRCGMKSYGQLCSMARALDVVGDRWTLLIVRELLIQGPLRFVELQRGLPGVASNLLTQRLRHLEEHGVLTQAPAPGGSTTRYRLTDRGLALDGVLRELLKWGAPTVATAPPDAMFQMHWLSQPAKYLLRDHRPQEPAVTVRFGSPGDGFDLTAGAGAVKVAPCRADAQIVASISGPGAVLVALLQGQLDLRKALENGVTIEGNAEGLTRVLPQGLGGVPDHDS